MNRLPPSPLPPPIENHLIQLLTQRFQVRKRWRIRKAIVQRANAAGVVARLAKPI